jgi:hypothetical protein
MTTLSRAFISMALATLCLLGGRAAQAAILSISPDQQSVAPGETVVAAVRLQSEHEIVNAAQVRVLYDAHALEVVTVSKAGSLLVLWPEEPKVDARAGVITFTGGIPNGSYVADGLLVTIVFRSLQLGQSPVLIDAGVSGVYRNDGLGTKAKLTVVPGTIDVRSSVSTLSISSPSHPDENAWYNRSIVQFTWTAAAGAQYAYTFSSDPNAQPDTRRGLVVSDATFSNVHDGTSYFILQEHLPNDTWAKPLIRRVNIDTTNPDLFTPQLTRDVIPGKLALVFLTRDATSSIVQYRVQEGGTITEHATSPYVLHDQTQHQQLTVTAYDAAGNATVATISPSTSPVAGKVPLVPLIVLGAILVLAGCIGAPLLWRHRKASRSR